MDTLTDQKNRWVQTLTLDPPSLKDNTADADRLVIALKSRLEVETLDLEIDLDLLGRLPELLRRCDYRVRCTLFKDRSRWFVSGIHDGRTDTPAVGLAVDLGTSTVVLHLTDLVSGEILAESSFNNPQITIGPDILARIHYADQQNGLLQLQALIIDGINRQIGNLSRSGGLGREDILLVSVAGNTAMTHLFLGLDPRWMIREPYIPVVNRPGLLRADEIGIQVSAGARVFVFPNIGSYFGGDLIAGILYSQIHRQEETAILVDVGTNAEVVLGNKHWLIACAGAAGPALEGGVTRMGMMAGPGVIDRVSIDRRTRRFDIHTIDDAPPKGICGSGLIDLAAELFLSGMIDIRGRFLLPACGHRVTDHDGLTHLEVVSADEAADGKSLTISQADLDSLIRSKAAMYTILETITTTVGVSMNELAAFYVAGTFGAFIQPASAIAIGMIPDLPLSVYHTLGNSCLRGATMALLSAGITEEIDQIRDRITYLELNVNQDFMNRFSAAKFLPHTDPTRFPSVR